MSTYMGGDPEFQVVSPKGNVQSPLRYKVPDKTNKAPLSFGRVFHDGFSVEMNPVPYNCRALFIEYLKHDLRRFRSDFLPSGHRLEALAAFDIGAKALREAPDEMRQFGCDPDYNAYTGQPNLPIPLNGDTSRRRFAGGHMHISDTFGVLTDPQTYPNIIKWADLLIGVPLSVIFREPDEFERRRFYGKAGSFRPQQYPGGYMGVEYRVPSPRLFNHPAILALFYGVLREIVVNLATAKFPEELSEDVRVAIDEGVGGEKLLRRVERMAPRADYGDPPRLGYIPDSIIALSQCSHVHKFQTPDIERESHYSWPEYPRDEWHIPLPPLTP